MSHPVYTSLPTRERRRSPSSSSTEDRSRYDSALDLAPGRNLKSGTFRKLLLVAFASLPIIAAFLLGITLVRHGIIPYRQSPTYRHCGSTPSEALARSCHYDVMIGSWLLPECSDPELMEEFIAERDWEFFKDANLTEAIPMDELRKGLHTYPVWATVHQHQHHCTYVWMKQFRAAARGGLMDDLSGNMDHTHHCAMGLYTGMPGAGKNLALAVKYFSCVEAGEGNPRRANNPNNDLVKGSK